MKFFLKLLFTILLVVCAISLFAWYYWYKPKLNHSKTRAVAVTATLSSTNRKILYDKAGEAKSFAGKNGYNRQICFMINMRMESGSNRFFVYRLDKDSIINTGLVTHGNCNNDWLTGRKYGNDVGCGCTALGKYKVGNSYNGKFGLAFKLYGLDSTNSNAYKRFVVLHAHSCVPEEEVSPAPICQSLGCPTVSPNYLKHLQKLIDNSNQPILLWIFDE